MRDHEPWILGIASSHNGGACLLHGSRIVAAIQEERLLRYKRADHPAAFSSLSIHYCLEKAGISARMLDAVVLCATSPVKALREDINLNRQLQVGRHGLKVFTIPHHYGHAVAVHALSGMSSSGVLVVDGSGSPYDELLDAERGVVVPGQLDAIRDAGAIPCETISLYVADEGAITPIEKHLAWFRPRDEGSPGLREFRSLGDMYGAIGCQIFGSFFEGPGKVMGLAPYGRPTIPVDEFYRTTPQGFEFQDAVRARFEHDEHWPRRQDEYADLAASVQRALEEAMLLLCGRVRQAHDHLGYAGGVALNSVANERIVRESGFRDVFIMPAAEDSGTAIGAAYYGLWQLCGYSRLARQQVDGPGGRYGDDHVAAAIRQVPRHRAVKMSSTADETAELLAQGKIVGWFQDGSELGPRALGHRSILCDPRPPDMKTTLNDRVKFREGFRPFAPVILEEDVHDWFDVTPEFNRSPFMLRVLPFLPEQAARVPAVVHVDGTGRVQTVSRTASPRLHQLLTAFKRRTGLPLLLNTSFNIAGEPIVETPADALWCFLYTDMDYCVLGEHLVSKTRDFDYVLDSVWSLRASSCFSYRNLQNGSGPSSTLEDATDRVVSAHLTRIEEIEVAARHWRWLQLVVVAQSPWGEVVHGLPGSFAQILREIDGRRTGREIHERLVAEGRAAPDAMSRFRRQMGMLRRIGAIEFTAGQQQQVARAV